MIQKNTGAAPNTVVTLNTGVAPSGVEGRRKLLARLLKEKGVAISAAPQAAVIPRRRDFGPAPLALNQEGLWFLDQLDPGKAHYNIPGAVRLQGKLEVAALEQSLSEIVRRHEALRTTFAMQEDGTPCQVIAPPTSWSLPLADLQTLPAIEREAEAKRLATAEAQQGFDLAQGPLFRAQLLRLGADEHVLILNVHHIVADGWSMGVFTNELRALYAAFSNGTPSPLPALPIQYADFAVWQRQQMSRENFQAQLAYWRQQLSGSSFVLQLPADRPRPPAQSFRGGHQAVKLSKPLTEALRMLALREEVTLFVMLLATLKVLLYRYTGQNDVIAGSTFANRHRRELRELIGFFVNTLPLRTRLADDLSFRELLRSVRETALGAAAHQELPLAKLVQELQPERDSSRNPLYQVVFDLLTPDHNPAVYGYGLSAGALETLELANLRVTSFEFEYNVARFDLAIFIWDFPEGLAGAFEYGADLFEPATVARLVEHFEILLNHVVADPDARVKALVERLDREDRQRQMAKEKTHQDAVHEKLKQSKRRPISSIS
jgi:hypothetical protein